VCAAAEHPIPASDAWAYRSFVTPRASWFRVCRDDRRSAVGDIETARQHVQSGDVVLVAGAEGYARRRAVRMCSYVATRRDGCGGKRRAAPSRRRGRQRRTPTEGGPRTAGLRPPRVRGRGEVRVNPSHEVLDPRHRARRPRAARERTRRRWSGPRQVTGREVNFPVGEDLVLGRETRDRASRTLRAVTLAATATCSSPTSSIQLSAATGPALE